MGSASLGLVAVEADGVVGVPAEGAVLAGVGAVVHVVDALGRRGVGRAGKWRRRKILASVSEAESSTLLTHDRKVYQLLTKISCI